MNERAIQASDTKPGQWLSLGHGRWGQITRADKVGDTSQVLLTCNLRDGSQPAGFWLHNEAPVTVLDLPDRLGELEKWAHLRYQKDAGDLRYYGHSYPGADKDQGRADAFYEVLAKIHELRESSQPPDTARTNDPGGAV